jgi:hypothetical protein
MTTMTEKAEQDLVFFMNHINNHETKNDIITMFMKGPPKGDGFTWCGREGGEHCHWTLPESRALKYIGNLVLDKDWDSAGYGIMMRQIQCQINIQQMRKSPQLFDDRKPLEVETGKEMAKEYQKTRFGKSMDENNKNALEVAANKGWDDAAQYMMDQAGGDYGKMRSMFG